MGLIFWKNFSDALDVLRQSEEVLAQGQEDNANGDAFGLVTVIYTVVLFLLGITSTFKNTTNKMVVLIIASVGFVLATSYMFVLPLPTGFSLFGFFG